MKIAVIVISVLLAAGLICFFTVVALKRLSVNKYKSYATGGALAAAKVWLVNHRPSKRRLIQLYAAVLYNANIKGFISGQIYTSETSKYMCVPGLNCYSCTGAVGACPMGAFQNALSESNTRAPYYVLGILAIFGLMLARVICGFLCPVGLCQELLYKARTPKLKKNRATRVFSYLKYVILALAIALPLIYASFDIPLPAFCKYICPAGTIGGAVMLLVNPANAGLFAQLGWQFTFKFCLAIGFIVCSVFIFRFFCRFLCPLGAIYGFFNRYALIGVTVDKSSCTDCGLCVAHCKMDVKRVGDHECINCGECMSVCPTKAIGWKGSKIFLHKDMTEDLAPAVKPLSVENGMVKIAQGDGGVVELARSEYIENSLAKAELAAYDTGEAVEKFKPSADVKTSKRPKKPVKYYLEMTAWIIAVAVLAVALILYNFVDVPKDGYIPAPPDGDVTVGNQVGDTAPDFTIRLYGTDGEQFNLYDNRGKITVVNFWATWCTPCVEEIPYFNELAVNYPELSVIAVHGSSTSDVEKFIDRKGWRDYKLTFAQDNLNGTQCQTYATFGGAGMWPMTVIIDADGKILYNGTQSFKDYRQLEELMNSLMN